MSSRVVLDDSRWAGVREIMGMSVPIILGMLSFTIMQFTDQLMVARVSKEALAAVGSAGIWSYLLSTFFVGVLGCVNTFASQSLGRGQTENCARYVWQGIYISLATGVLILALWPVAEPLFRAMNHSEAVTRYEIQYFQIRLASCLFIALQTALSSFFFAVRMTTIPMFVSVLASIANIMLNYLLIFGKLGFPRLDVAGAAIATVLSQLLQAVILFWIFMSRPIHTQFGSRTTYQFDWVRIVELFRIGWPSGITGFLDIGTWSIFTSFLVGSFGTVALAAHVGTMEFLHFSFMPALGIHIGITAIVGQWIGQGDIVRAKARTHTAVRICIMYMTLMGIALAIFAKPLFRLCFSADEEVVRLGQILLIYCAVFQAFDATSITLFGALRGAGDTLWLCGAFLFGNRFLFLPLAWFLSSAMGFGAPGAWCGATIYIIFMSGLLSYRFYGEKWRHIRIFTEDRVKVFSE